jgi:hypothetical protein
MQVDLKPDQWTKPVQTGKADFFRMRMAEKMDPGRKWVKIL